MRKTFCDGCGSELHPGNWAGRSSEIHMELNGNKFCVTTNVASNVNTKAGNNNLITNDGDLCTTCFERIIRNGEIEY